MSSTEPKPKQSTRGQLLGALVASARLQSQGVQQPSEGAQIGQGQRFTVQDALAKIDEMRMRLRGQTGWAPGLVAERRAFRRSEVLAAVSSSKTVVKENPGPKEETPAPPPAPKATFRCPWENCGFETEDTTAFQLHVSDHSRFHPRTY